MAALVAITMTITATFLYQQQYAAMMDQVKGYGGSLAKFMATQNAVPLLSEDWAAIDVFIQETLGRQDFNYIIVVDDKGVVRASNDAAEVNEKYARAGGHAAVVERSGRHRAEPPHRRRPRRCSTSRRRCCSRARRSARCTSASTRRR